jgi:hypothetical protein
MINEMGCIRFADETNQSLSNFYSYDKWAEYEYLDEHKRRRRKKKKTNFTPTSTNVSEDDQNMLWELPHSATDHNPGKLSICIGMPVMIRHNIATELCITKGQEGTVAGWQCHDGPYGVQVLDAVFVRLSNPPNEIKLDGLPLNVVPIPKLPVSTTCRLKDDQLRKVDRLQVPILPNFSMTDYASQGKTRENNVVDLTHCKTHQSYYTALSRSATAAGTLIVQSFSPSPIVGGISGWLRQEFRELELLDEITKLAYCSKLPPDVNSHRRNTIICQYREWKGSTHVPEHVHPSIQWHGNKTYPITQSTLDSPWQIIDKKSVKTVNETLVSHTQPAKGSIAVPNNKKRKLDDSDEKNAGVAKKLKLSVQDIPNDMQTPVGPEWDAENYSCAYDALYSILCYLWTTNPHKWNKVFQGLNPEMAVLANGFQKVLAGNMSLEVARDRVRNQLHQLNSEKFQWGKNGTSVSDIAYEMLRKVNGVEIWCKYNTCDVQNHAFADNGLYFIDSPVNLSTASTSQILQTVMRYQIHTCHYCNQTMEYGLKNPKLIVLNIPGHRGPLERKLFLKGDKGQNNILYLRGIVYHGSFHFVSRIITNDNKIWFHDGIVGKNALAQGNIQNVSDKHLTHCNGKVIALAIYAQK